MIANCFYTTISLLIIIFLLNSCTTNRLYEYLTRYEGKVLASPQIKGALFWTPETDT